MNRTVVIRVGPVEQARRELKEDLTAITAGDRLKERREIWFPSLAQLASVLTEARLGLLQLIHEKHPASVVRLARLAGRSEKSTAADLRTLADVGLVKWVSARGGQRPVARYDRIHIAGDITLGRAARPTGRLGLRGLTHVRDAGLRLLRYRTRGTGPER